MFPPIVKDSTVDKPTAGAQIDMLLDNIQRHERWRAAIHCRSPDREEGRQRRKYYLVTSHRLPTGRVRRRYKVSMQQTPEESEKERSIRQILNEQKKFLLNYKASIEQRRQLLLPANFHLPSVRVKQDRIETPRPSGIEIVVSSNSITHDNKMERDQDQLSKLNISTEKESGATTPKTVVEQRKCRAIPQCCDALQVTNRISKHGFLLTPNTKHRVENWLNSIRI